ncbi:MAG: hypothetical protein AAGC63_16735 [Propionicimonas sp.]|nr:hypothetical protein [Propionicimonas sp.]
MARKDPAQPKPERKTRSQAKASGLVLSGVPRVNLLPASEVERRAAGQLVRRWAAGLAVTAVVVGGMVAGASLFLADADRNLAAEQNRTLDLNAELGELSPVSRAIAERASLNELRSDAMGNDLEWRSLFAEVDKALPGGVQLAGVNLITGANPVPEVEPTAGIGLIGVLTFSSDDPADQYRTVAALRKLDVVIAAEAGKLAAAESGFTFGVEVVVDQTHYSGTFQSPEGAK